ncbi:CAF17-like 4Fe-4S cluster assembly/insertion protein YgfZ [Streptomyces gardneri]|uniref:Folate-binding protein n=1 Tax=Streptomyces gardneri TaxID=66892 RepID=A0A4Y3RKF3_9ACTN|nr:glycine cleavage T C-terminal barrel domain-containing protein [Streptomyces gardneri]ALO09943.1 Folate-dependent protein for Fe or S cluster synthesis or repair in oxidative stress [Streptomyces venezuelae]QPK46984.1 folate-binding protein YgfZ [Streptomyces gardneri]WRK38400.1 glycine cleavage T C-terminal barrel domain-containing protein [Streptomyces venezuelae]CUM39613.1 Folate-dependent protein for Fe/S cluster synthesis/repair in oxidative stress [Streptomyces venezuelae]GEB58321.1 f
MKSPLLSLPGAVAAEGRDEGVAAHYGDLFREQRALADGSGFVDLSHRGVVAVTGDDRLSWLHLLVTQHMTDLAPGRATEALILSANGHIEHALYLVDDGETVWAHVEPGTRDELVAYLESMKFFYRVEVADRTDDIAVVHLPAGSIAEVPEGAVVRETPHGRDLFLPRADLESFAASHGPAAGVLAYEALRVEGHRPRLGFETDHRTIPHEVGLIGSAVHLQKGCYRGQETVARVQNLGKPPRRLVFLHLDGSEVLLPAHGAPVRLAADGEEGRQLGFVTSAVRHYELGPIALALVKRNVPVDAPLLVGNTAAAQETVVEP